MWDKYLNYDKKSPAAEGRVQVSDEIHVSIGMNKATKS